MTEFLSQFLQDFSQYAPAWGLLVIFTCMAIESSFIPFPSEVVMIPAGFMAARGELTCGAPLPDICLVFLSGTAGAMAGAYINYFLALKLGEPFLRKYGKYFFISPATVDRCSELFRKYGDLATFACRLLPGIRQLISIPAGLARMNLMRFSLFTAVGAGIWNIILMAAGFYFGRLAGEMSYGELVHRGKAIITGNYGWIILGTLILGGAYYLLQRLAMGKLRKKQPQE
jgi:membrane protein DedA with SNARE-associated domain